VGIATRGFYQGFPKQGSLEGKEGRGKHQNTQRKLKQQHLLRGTGIGWEELLLFSGGEEGEEAKGGGTGQKSCIKS